MKFLTRSIAAAAFLIGCIMLLPIGWGEANPAKVETGVNRRIAWYGVLEDGLAEAKRTGKPIMLLSAAPQCAGVSGMW